MTLAIKERTNLDLHNEMIKKAENLIPILKERSESANADRRIPKETIQDMKDAGFFKILQPKQYGGYELDPHTFSEVQLRVAQGCMSTAWVLGVVGIHPFQLALYDKKAQKEVWGEDDNTLVSSSYAPMGQVTPVEGGFKFSGHWQWSSGSEHCDWALLGGLIFPPEGGAPEYRTFLIPKSDYEIKDTWYSMGLKATGSQDIHVNDVFVPEYRTHKQSDGFNLTNPGYEVNKNNLFKIPWGQLFVRAVSTPAIGATKKMLELIPKNYELPKNLKFLVRFHPGVSEYFKKNNNSNIIFSKNNIIEDLKMSSWVVYRGTGAVIHSLNYGIRPIYYFYSKNELSLDPLYNLKEYKKKIKNFSQLLKIINQDLSEDFFNKKKKYINKVSKKSKLYFSNINYGLAKKLIN